MAPKKHLISETNFDTPVGEPKRPLRPMLAEFSDKPFDKKNWLFEIKWDGYRAIAETYTTPPKLYSRNGLSFAPRFPVIISDLEKIVPQCVLDGEIVVVDSRGKSDFALLQNYHNNPESKLLYYVFDLLYLQNHDIRPLPLIKRKNLLKKLLPSLDHIRFCDHIYEHGKEFFNIAKVNNLEGIIGKDKNSPYLENTRSGYWLKIKVHCTQDVVVGGFTESASSRTGFGALVCGIYENDNLVYTGNVGNGFTDNLLHETRHKLN
ncbi:MAG: hypothetical protein Q4F84_06275, partial [Fibrobacter sp.]|nr:hypothetical protein [Fibrobacter sp.]